MTAWLFLALLAAFLAGFGGRDQHLVAALRAKLGSSIPLVVTALVCSALITAAMALAGARIGTIIPAPAKIVLVGLAVVLAACKLFWPVRQTPLREPTRSLGALSLVLLFRQIGDGPRLLVFAIAAVSLAPIPVGIGGAIGGCGALLIGYVMGAGLCERLPLRMIRVGVGFIVLAVSVITVFFTHKIL